MGLRPPPLIPLQPEISRSAAKAPRSAGLREVDRSLNGALGGKCDFPDSKSLAQNFFFLGNRDAGCGDRFERGRCLKAQAKCLVLPGPFDRHVAKAGDADSAWQSSIEGRVYQGRR